MQLPCTSMMITPAPALRAVPRRHNTLRNNPALSAIAAVMNGVDPEPADVAALADAPIDVATLHQAAVVALRQAMGPYLRSRTSAGIARGGPTSTAPAESTLMDAYYLASHLAERRVAPQRMQPEQIEAAMLIGAMQIRFLESVCAQIVVDVITPELSVPPKVPARYVLRTGGNIAPGVRLLADYTAAGDGPTSWLHALSTITVAGTPGRGVVDAGPGNASAQWAARLAAPVTVAAAEGFWPVSAVEDCLRISAGAVRRWVAAMPRELCGPDGRDIMLRSGPPLRDFLVSPATAALTGDSGRAPILPLRAAPGVGNSRTLRGALAAMRTGGTPGTELSADQALPARYRIGEMHRDEIAALTAAVAEELPADAEVTINFAVPEWKDVAVLVDGVRETRAVTLTAPVLGWIDRDVVAGQLHRVSLRARVHRGVVCESAEGTAVLLAAGTTFTVLGADAGKGHITLYAVQAEPAEVASPSRTHAETAA